MTEHTQFETTMGCEAFEVMCLDAVDGTLTAVERAVFERHIASCSSCSEQLAEAQRGAAWMEMLKGHKPEPPAGMLQRILAQTSEAEMSRVFPRFGAVPTPTFNVVPVLGKRERLSHWVEATFFNPNVSAFQPRMAMTAAMAFFSLALTMNLSGVRLTDLRPSAIHRTVADAHASAARQIQSLKVVNQLESRVNELRDDDQGYDSGRNSQVAPKREPAHLDRPKPSAPAHEDESKKPRGTSEVIQPGIVRAQEGV